jgi:hypothetical protein
MKSVHHCFGTAPSRGPNGSLLDVCVWALVLFTSKLMAESARKNEKNSQITAKKEKLHKMTVVIR